MFQYSYFEGQRLKHEKTCIEEMSTLCNIDRQKLNVSIYISVVESIDDVQWIKNYTHHCKRKTETKLQSICFTADIENV